MYIDKNPCFVIEPQLCRHYYTCK